MNKLVAILGLSLIVIACDTKESTPNPNDGVASFSVADFETRIVELSSDKYQGRMPFSEGEKITLDYLQQEFKAMGVEPGNGGSYLQEVPLVKITTTAAPSMEIKGGKTSFSLEGLKDYVLWTEQPVEKVMLTEDDLVFAGFGIVAPEYNWNDYDGVDVKDKIVVVLVNDPGFGAGDSTLFKGNTMTYYGRWTYKFEEAARQGAKGCLVIHDDVPAGYGFWVVQNSWNAGKLYLDERGKETQKCAAVGWISQPTAKKLFEAAGLDYAEQLSKAHKNDFASIDMNLKASTSMKTEVKYDMSYNVAAKITGTTAPDEYIIYSAHWDHLGIGKADEKGDSIYNGALDNATGTAGLLEIAKAFTTLKTKPNRSILFLAVTAEEQGLLGSAYYAQNPIYPKEKTVANINMDGINPYGKTRDIVLVGMGQSDMEDYLTEAAKNAGRYVAPEPNPVAGYYFRSDHFNFAKVGIPALYTGNGIDMVEGGKEAGKKLEEEYVATYYHKPSDEYDATRWNLEGGVDDLILLFQVGKKLSMEMTWPKWKPTSEFKPIRDGYMK